MNDLFETSPSQADHLMPLAERLRPTSIEDVIGQDHILDPDAPLGAMLGSKTLGSIIFWGPPGVGKTTLARGCWRSTRIFTLSKSAQYLRAFPILKSALRRQSLERVMGAVRCFLWMKFIGLTKPSRTGFCPIWKTARFCLLGRQRKTHRLN